MCESAGCDGQPDTSRAQSDHNLCKWPVPCCGRTWRLYFDPPRQIQVVSEQVVKFFDMNYIRRDLCAYALALYLVSFGVNRTNAKQGTAIRNRVSLVDNLTPCEVFEATVHRPVPTAARGILSGHTCGYRNSNIAGKHQIITSIVYIIE